MDHDLQPRRLQAHALAGRPLEGALVRAHKVVAPRVVGRVDGLGRVGRKGRGRVAGRVDVRQPEAVPALHPPDRDRGVGRDRHGQDGVALVVDVLADQVDAAWWRVRGRKPKKMRGVEWGMGRASMAASRLSCSLSSRSLSSSFTWRPRVQVRLGSELLFEGGAQGREAGLGGGGVCL